jgi:sRNA-binding protein
MKVPPFFILMICFGSTVLADDFKTTEGKEYKDATVSRIEPDGIVVRTKSGISKLYFVELPQEVQRRFNYEPQQARAYSAEQAANYAAIQKQEEEAQRQREEAERQNKPALVAQQPEQRPEQQPNSSVPSHRGRARPTPSYTTVLHELPHEHTRVSAGQAGAAPHPPAPSHPKKEKRPHQ